MEERQERILQFGEGNFLRAFVCWMVNRMNATTGFNGSIVVTNNTPRGGVDALRAQDCCYHVLTQGRQGEQIIDTTEKIDCISRAINPYTETADFMALADSPTLRFVVSNTTEAGLSTLQKGQEPFTNFPYRLTRLLYRRFQTFGGAQDKGWIILPCELLFGNGQVLRACIDHCMELMREELGADYEPFSQWVHTCNPICTTLVDRIVPGFPHQTAEAVFERIGRTDKLLVQGEVFHLWVIEVPEEMDIDALKKEFPAEEAGLNVLFVRDEKPYHQRKVTLLNGPHTVLSPVSWLAGLDLVRHACQHPVVGAYIQRVKKEELLETLDLPREELLQFADDVLDRFNNPYVDHPVTSIMLNSFAKYASRNLPGLKCFMHRKGTLPQGLVLGLAAILVSYSGYQRADGMTFTPKDDTRILELVAALWQTGDPDQVAQGILADQTLWGEDLNLIPGLTQLLAQDMRSILENGMLETLKAKGY